MAALRSAKPLLRVAAWLTLTTISGDPTAAGCISSPLRDTCESALYSGDPLSFDRRSRYGLPDKQGDAQSKRVSRRRNHGNLSLVESGEAGVVGRLEGGGGAVWI